MALLLKDLEPLFQTHRVCVRNSLHHPNLYLLHKGDRLAYLTVRGRLAVVSSDDGEQLRTIPEIIDFFDRFRLAKSRTAAH